MAELKIGTILKTELGNSVEVLQKLGEGGQGIVYKVSYGGEEKALKWYFRKALKNYDLFKSNLINNIEKGSPAKNFLWPIDITYEYDDSFGYVMDMRKKGYYEFSEYLLKNAVFPSITARINAAINIVAGFRDLHNKGYIYQDLNDGNFFIEPKTGDVQICDNDNVTTANKKLGIAGKCRYMAPEIVVGKATPSTYSDRFSLAVILFHLLFMGHPLEGKGTLPPCMTEELERKYYGENPVFVYDPNDSSNRPAEGVHKNVINLWKLYPQYVRDKFIEAFTKEAMIGEGNKRIIEKEWLKLFARLRGDIMTCGWCKEETFISADQEMNCINCQRQIKIPISIKNKDYNIPLFPGQRVYYAQIVHDMVNQIEKPFAKIITAKNNPRAWGIRNMSGNKWYVYPPNGEKEIAKENGEVLRLAKGLKIEYENGKYIEIG